MKKRSPDIIVLLVVGLLLLLFFAGWQWFLEHRTPMTALRITPLVPLGVFALDHGRVSFLFLVAVSFAAGSANRALSADLPFCFEDFVLCRVFWLHVSHDAIPRGLSRSSPQQDFCKTPSICSRSIRPGTNTQKQLHFVPGTIA